MKIDNKCLPHMRLASANNLIFLIIFQFRQCSFCRTHSASNITWVSPLRKQKSALLVCYIILLCIAVALYLSIYTCVTGASLHLKHIKCYTERTLLLPIIWIPRENRENTIVTDNMNSRYFKSVFLLWNLQKENAVIFTGLPFLSTSCTITESNTHVKSCEVYW